MATPSNLQASPTLAEPCKDREMLLFISVFFASAICLLSSFKLFGPARGLISIWPLTAVELAFCIAGRRGARRGLIIQMFASSGIIAASAFCHLPWHMTAVVLVLSQLEVFVAQRLLGAKVSQFDDLRRAKGMVRFGIVSVACPTGVAALAAVPLAFILHRSLWATAVSTAIADSLGYVTLLPLLLLCFSGPVRQIRLYKPDLRAAIPASALFLVISVYAFWQVTNPVLFLIFPPLLFVVFTLGLEGAVLATSVLALVGSLATKFDHGALVLAQAGQKTHALFLLQGFLWIASATALPVGSLLGEQRRARRRATEAELIYSTLLQNTEDVIILSSLDGTRRYVSPSVSRLTGWTPDEFLQQDRFSILHPDDRELGRNIVKSILDGKQDHTFRYRVHCKDDSWRWVEASVRGYKEGTDASVRGYVATVRDVSERRNQERAWNAELSELTLVNRELAVAANTDKLTGLQNRRGLDEALQRIPAGSLVSLLLLDVDHFKAYNDLYGHLSGDECLKQLADTLREATARIPTCTLARFGGEEFAILLSVAEQDGALFLAKSILQDLDHRHIAHGGSPRGFVTMSIGVSSWIHEETKDISPMIQLADKALYQSKGAGRNRVTVAGERILTAA